MRHGAALHTEGGERRAGADPPAGRGAGRPAQGTAAARGSSAERAGKVAGNGGGLDPRAVQEEHEAEQRARVEIARCVNEIHGRGAIVKDIDQGLVDFLAVREGEEILLCWRLGEDEITHWHSLEEGFAGRKRLDPE